MPLPKTRILVVDDDAKTVAAVRLYLEHAGYQVDTAADGRAALERARADPEREPGEPEPRFVTTVNRWLLLSAVAAVALAFALSLALSRRILGPVEAITAAARRMEGGDLTQRVPATSRDEIGDLARAFNAMADAVARSESLRRALVADVAHELRTPLTNLRCQIEAVQDGLQAADAATLRSLLLLARLVGDRLLRYPNEPHDLQQPRHIRLRDAEDAAGMYRFVAP